MASATGVKAQAALPVTWQEAVEEARGSGPEGTVAEHRTLAANTEATVASRWPNPQIWLGSSANFARLYGYVRFSFPVFGQMDSAETAAHAQAHVAVRDQELTWLVTEDAVRRAWIALWLQQKIARITAENQERAEQLARAAQTRFEAGTAPRLDVLRSHSEASRIRADALAQHMRLAAFSARLAVLLGRDASESNGMRAEGDLPSARAGMLTQVATAELPEALQRLVTQHPRVQRAEAQLHATEAVITREDRARWPLLGVELGGNAFYANNTAPDVHAALLFNLPLFDLDGPTVARARAQSQVAASELHAENARVHAEIVAAYADARAAAEVAEAFRTEVLPDTDEAATLASEGYAAGRFDINALIFAHQALSDARLAAVRAEAEAASTWSVLLRCLGGTP